MSHCPDPPHTPAEHGAAHRAAGGRAWAAYAIALGATAVTSLAHWALGAVTGDPLLELFLLPILLGAYLGGSGPGLAATAAAAFSAALLLEPQGLPVIARPLDRAEVAVLTLAGSLASWAASRPPGARRDGAASRQLLEAALASIGDAVITADPRGRVTFLNAEEELRASEARYHQALDSMLEGCQIIGFDWCYRYVNQSAARHGRVDRSMILGRGMLEVFPNIEATPLFAALRRCMEQRRAERLEHQFIYADGSSAWFDLSVQPSPEGLFVLSIEISERKEAEAALVAERARLAERVAEATTGLRQANTQLAAAARLKDEFLAIMSHELRTPLNAILGYTELLRDEVYGPISPRQAGVLQSLGASGHHLHELISDILDLSKLAAGRLTLEPVPVDVGALCRRGLHAVNEEALRRRIELSASLDPLVGTLVADERRLLQILVNLLANAIKFTPEGGRVGLELRGDGGTATFTVWDTGIGIAEADLGQLFQPFCQLDSGLNRQYEGTGLGLALAQRLAMAHGGAITVTSAPGEGSRFSVALPWAGLPAHASPASPAPG